MDDLVGTAAQPVSGMVYDAATTIDIEQVAREVLADREASKREAMLARAMLALSERYSAQAGFRREIAALINRYSLENGSDTPDFILAEYLAGCLSNFDDALRARERWYGRQVFGKVSQQVDGPAPSASDPSRAEKSPGVPIADVKAGDQLIADDDFSCMKAGTVREVKQNERGLYLDCDDGKHYLSGQIDTWKGVVIYTGFKLGPF